ncbi:MAG: hypothetical protein L6Q98_01685 [Anaerolineae bacterium]|nr:hypothetical protein [Anaerolineae bacterium]NUQ05495.1 hypothetical protein [Anaerolineae bacterium]
MVTTYELAHVWKAVEPAIPDTIEQVGPNVYEARWWKPVPRQDIQLICHAKHIEIIGEPFEPHHLPSGVAVRFKMDH